jgi:adenylate cyclase
MVSTPRIQFPRLRWVDTAQVANGADDRSGVELVRTVQKRLWRLGWIAAAIGTVVVFNSIGFLIPLFTDPADRSYLGLLNAPFIVVYLLLGGLFVDRLTGRDLNRSFGWIAAGTAPTEAEHRLTLTFAMRTVKRTAFGWAIAAVLFAILNGVAYSWGLAAVVGSTIWLGGEATCAIFYLASERILRPITARALEDRQPGKVVTFGVRARLGMAWALGTGVPLLGILVVGIVGVTKGGVDTEYVAAAALFLAALASALGLLVTYVAARAIADPVTSVRAGLEQIERGDLEAQVAVDDASEVGLLQAGFNRMAEGLRERERIRDLFGRQVGEDVARAALRDGSQLGGEERQIGALFIDLVGSTSMALAMPPSEVVRLLNRFFRVVVEVVEKEAGFVNKFEGDAALCVFGAPVRSEDPAGDALRAARLLAERLSEEVPEVDFGIGVSAGTAVAGNVGAERRFEYTVIGDPVNEAARISELAKQHSERVLASAAALRASEAEHGAWHEASSALLRGRKDPTNLAQPRS